MSFPDVQRFIYEKNPIEEVVCQVRYPSILKIDAEAPVGFQETLRDEYPYFESKTSPLFSGVPEEMAAIFRQGFPAVSGPIAYEFASADKVWTVLLTRDFLSLSCRKYTHWEEFNERYQRLLNALKQYSPAFFIRIGLRYRNIIRRRALELEKAGWADLLKPWIAGAFNSEDVAADIEVSAHQLLIRLADCGSNSKLQVRHGLALDPVENDQCYIIDADFFDEAQTEPNDALHQLECLNRQSGRFFQWCIQPRLHDALRPRQL